MKRIKKLLAVMLAAIMVMSMGTSVFADDDSSGDDSSSTTTTTYSISISNANNGETYSAYKIFDATYSDSGAVSYTISSSSSFFNAIKTISNLNEDEGATQIFKLTATASDSTVYVVELMSDYSSEEKNSDVTSAVITAIKGVLNNAYSTVTADATATASIAEGAETASATITLSSAGYYYVSTSTGSVVSLDTAAPTASVQDKNTAPTVDKKVSDSETETYASANTAGIGDTVYFKATISNINDAANIKFHDSMTTGLTFSGATSVTVKLYSSTTDEEPTTLNQSGESADYTVTTGSTSITDGCDFEIDFSTYLSSATGLTDNSYLEITYTATVNSDAVIDSAGTNATGNTNTAQVSYGNASTSTVSTTTTYVYELNVFKYYTDSDSSETALSNASFVLYKIVTEGTDEVKYYAVVSDGKLTGWTKYLTASDTGYGSETDKLATTLTSDTNGMIYIDGLDAGTYYLLETEAPDGYNKLTSAVTVTITAASETYAESLTYGNSSTTGAQVTVNSSTVSNVVKVENKAGSTLPTTGGIGTTIFYVVGAILVLGAGVVLITRRRMASR